MNVVALQAVVLALAVGLSNLVASVLRDRAHRPDQWANMIDRLEKEIDRLQDRVDRHDVERNEWRNERLHLQEQLLHAYTGRRTATP